MWVVPKRIGSAPSGARLVYASTGSNYGEVQDRYGRYATQPALYGHQDRGRDAFFRSQE